MRTGGNTQQQHPPVRADFDVLTHHRRRTRKAEARAETLEQINDRLYRLLALALLAACTGRNLDPATLLAVIEDIEASA